MMAQMGFFDLSDRYASLDVKKDSLVEIDAVVPWEEFRPVLDEVWREPDAESKSRARRKLMDAVLMFKMLVLTALYNLLDNQIEYQVRDRLSFMARQGYIAPGGQILDVSIVSVPLNHNTRDESKAIKNDEMPEDWADKPAKRSQKDVDARWTKSMAEAVMAIRTT